MYVVSDKFKSAIESTSRSMNCKAYLRGIEFSVDKILKLDIEDNINNGDYFTIGEVPSRSLTIEMIGVQGLVEGDEIKPYYGVEVSPGEFEYVPCGVFYVDSLTINKDKISATCYDKMLSLEEEYTPNIAIPVTLTEIMNDICQQKGIEFEGELPNITLSKSIKGYSYREMIGFIASFCGGNAKFNRLGKLVIQQYAQTGKIVNPDVCASFEHKDVYTVSAIACKFGDVANTRGDSSANCVNFTNPYVDDSNIDSIFNLLNGLTFTAANFKYKGDPSVDSGDLITINDVKGNSHVVLVSTQDFKFSGGLTSEITSIGEGKGANAYKQYKFKNKKSITELNVELGLIQGIISEVQEKQEDTYTKTETETLIEAKAGEISLSVAKNEVSNLQIGGANLFGQHTSVVASYHVTHLTRENQTGFEVTGHVDNDGTVKIDNIIDSNGWYTISFDVKCQVNGWFVDVDFCDGVKKRFDNISTTDYTHCTYSYEVTNYSSDVYNFVDISGLSAQRFWFKNIKIEKGNKETAYTPSFTDIESSIAKIDVKADEINLSVENVKKNIKDNYSTTTEMNSAIQQKADSITSTVEVTKTSGVELLPQSYRGNSTAGYHVSSGSIGVNVGGIFTHDRSWWYTDKIIIDRTKPIFCTFGYYTHGRGRTYVGLEQYDENGNSFLDNDGTIYWTSNEDVNNSLNGEFTIYENHLNERTRYVRLRVLINWDSSTEFIYTQFYNLSVKQLHAISASTQIAQMSDKIELKVEVDGVKSIMRQSPEDLRVGFNGMTDNLVAHANGLRTNASDGSYSEFQYGKMTHYIAGEGHKYHSLIHVETIRLYNEWGIIDGYFSVPPRYRGLNFNVIASISYVGFDRSVAHAFKNLNVSVTEINSSNCTYRLQVTPIGVDVQGAYTVNASKVECVVTIIA